MESPDQPSGRIILADNRQALAGMPAEAFDLIYIDPPFNTGRTQRLARIRTVRDETAGDRVGFGGRRYRSVPVSEQSFEDRFDDYLEFLRPRLRQAHRLLAPQGSFFLHVDHREVHYCKVLLDEIFGRACFQNEIIWAYDFGARSRRRWPAKHDNILWYSRDPKRYTFRYEAMERIPYMAPGLVGPVKASRGKTPTDVWWHTIVPTRGAERTGYPTQKPLGVLRRIVEVHSNPGEHVLDFFAGSGTTGEAAARSGRSFTLIDNRREAVLLMARRLAFARPVCVGFEPEIVVPGGDG
jgi:site-specific DNA-methyltransferase (adenine-specific)